MVGTKKQMSGTKGKSDMKITVSTENIISTQEYSGRTIETIKGARGFWCRWKRPTGHIWKATRHYAFRNAAYSQAINAICDEEVDSCGWNDPTWRDGV